MRGIGYAIAEIAVFMIAATLIGYVLGRLSPSAFRARRAAHEGISLREQLDAAERAASDLERQAVALTEGLGSAEDRILELEAESVEMSNDASGADDGDNVSMPIGDDEIEELVAEIDRQREMIERLERVAEDVGDLHGQIAEREAEISRLEASLATGEPPAARIVAYSAASSATGRYADTTIDFELTR